MRTKAGLRKELKNALSSMSDSEHEDISINVSKNLNKLLRSLDVIQKNLVIGVFAPIEKEPKWFLKLDEELLKLTAYPAFDKEMVFRLAQLSDLKTKKDFGVEILGPELAHPIITPNIIIVPGLGFSTDGKRLGRGKGFYDRYLEKSSAIKIGIAFEMQIKADIPTDPHDVVMNFVVTDHNVIEIK